MYKKIDAEYSFLAGIISSKTLSIKDGSLKIPIKKLADPPDYASAVALDFAATRYVKRNWSALTSTEKPW